MRRSTNKKISNFEEKMVVLYIEANQTKLFITYHSTTMTGWHEDTFHHIRFII